MEDQSELRKQFWVQRQELLLFFFSFPFRETGATAGVVPQSDRGEALPPHGV